MSNFSSKDSFFNILVLFFCLEMIKKTDASQMVHVLQCKTLGKEEFCFRQENMGIELLQKQ